jgi:hypothetical protein
METLLDASVRTPDAHIGQEWSASAPSLIAQQFDELARLEDGWCDGHGIAPDRDKLKAIARKMADSYPKALPMPSIVPTQDGNLLLEWDVCGYPSTDIDLGIMTASFHAFGSNGEDVEAEFALGDAGGFEAFFAFLSEHIQIGTKGKTRAELREAWRQEGLAAWEEYQLTGLHLTNEEAKDWLAQLAAGNNVEPPECHV